MSSRFNSDGTKIITASYDKTVKLWNNQTGENEKTFEEHTKDVMCAAFSPDGTKVASCSSDKTTIIRDISSGQKVLTLREFQNARF